MSIPDDHEDETSTVSPIGIDKVIEYFFASDARYAKN